MAGQEDEAGPARVRSRGSGRVRGAAPSLDEAPCLELSIPSQTAFLGIVREVAFDLGCWAGLGDTLAEQVALAVVEAVTNVIEHAYDGAADGRIDLRFYRRKGELRIELVDTGRAVDPVDVPSVDLERYRRERRTGGLGIHLMARIMDSVTFVRREGRNLCCLVKRVPPADGAAT
jgi:serine/threonine-protein kinase RsbW